MSASHSLSKSAARQLEQLPKGERVLWHGAPDWKALAMHVFHVRAVATLGWDWQFRAPILVGDRIHAEVEVVERRETRRPDRAILVQAVRALKQDGTVVQEGRHTLMVRRRPGGDAA